MDGDLFSPLKFFFLTVFTIECIVSLIGNGIIIVLNGCSWLQSKKMLPCDFLLTTLSLSRFLWQWVSVSSQFVFLTSPETYACSKTQQGFTSSWIYLNTASLWCATWLNVFYCVKVTSFAHPLFVQLKLRTGVLVPRFLAISLLVFIVCSISPLMGYFEDEECSNLTRNLPEMINQHEAHDDYYALKLLDAMNIFFTAISFSICLTASGVLLLSLWRHRRNLKKSGLGTKDLSSQAHLNVMKPLLLLLVFYIVHFAAMLLILGRIFEYGKLEWLISDIFMSAYPSVHSVVLIRTNPKLRKLCAHVLRSSPS